VTDGRTGGGIDRRLVWHYSAIARKSIASNVSAGSAGTQGVAYTSSQKVFDFLSSTCCV